MTTNPTAVRGEVWRTRFDPAEGDEIKKVRTAVVVSENAVGGSSSEVSRKHKHEKQCLSRSEWRRIHPFFQFQGKLTPAAPQLC